MTRSYAFSSSDLRRLNCVVVILPDRVAASASFSMALCASLRAFRSSSSSTTASAMSSGMLFSIISMASLASTICSRMALLIGAGAFLMAGTRRSTSRCVRACFVTTSATGNWSLAGSVPMDRALLSPIVSAETFSRTSGTTRSYCKAT